MDDWAKTFGLSENCSYQGVKQFARVLPLHDIWEDLKKRDGSLQVFEFMHNVAATRGDIPTWIRHKVRFFPSHQVTSMLCASCYVTQLVA